MLKLALITHEYHPVLSGGTIFTEKLATELAALGWEVDVLTARVVSGSPALEASGPFHVRRFRTARSSTADSTLREHLSYFALGLPQMLAYARSRRYDLLFPVFAIPSGLMALAIAKLLRIPTVVFVDAADTPGVESAMKSYVRYMTSVFRLVTNNSNGVVICEGLEDLAMPHIRNPRVTAIPNGTVIPEKLANPGRNGPKLEILSIGRLVLRKGFDEIIRALSIVKKKRGDFHLRIVGYGTQEEAIRRVLDEHGIGDNVSMLGRVEYAELADYYLGSDCYLFYGDREGSSLAMVEAVSYGLPLIASDHPGNRAYIADGESGLLVEHKNPEKLSRAILDLLEHRERLPAMGAKSRAIAASFSWANVAKRYDAFFRRVLGSA
jgi:phosphatidylinositol alpha-1,6-mannosyltransferase